jgi:hypothetical protein
MNEKKDFSIAQGLQDGDTLICEMYDEFILISFRRGMSRIYLSREDNKIIINGKKIRPLDIAILIGELSGLTNRTKVREEENIVWYELNKLPK